MNERFVEMERMIVTGGELREQLAEVGQDIGETAKLQTRGKPNIELEPGT